MTARRLDARHKIQLGGLVILSGLRDALGLEGDLQKDVSQDDNIAVLVGSLDHLRQLLDSDTDGQLRSAFKARGQQLLDEGKEAALAKRSHPRRTASGA